MSYDIKFIRLDQKHVGLARQASPFLRSLWFRLINLKPKTLTCYSLYIGGTMKLNTGFGKHNLSFNETKYIAIYLNIYIYYLTFSTFTCC